MRKLLKHNGLLKLLMDWQIWNMLDGKLEIELFL